MKTCNDCHNSVLCEKYQILAKMSKHQETLDTYKEFSKRGINCLALIQLVFMNH